MVKIIDSAYANADLEQVATNATQMNYYEENQLLYIFNKFE